MTKQRKGVETTFKFIIFFIVTMAIIGLFLGFTYRIIWGPCWADTDNEMGEITKGFKRLGTTTGSIPVSITLGECVWRLDFVSESEMREFKKNAGEFGEEIKCSGPSIVAIPYFESKDKILEWKFWKIPKNILRESKEWIEKNVRGIKPLCRELDKDVNSLAIFGPGRGETKTICLELSKVEQEEDKYEYKVEEVACEKG